MLVGRCKNYSVGGTTVFSPTAVNDARVGFYTEKCSWNVREGGS
jgi:hypothetical protein